MADKIYQIDFELSDGTIKSVQFTAPQGPQGPQGPAGKGAYDYAKEQGYPGTEEQFAKELNAILINENVEYVEGGGINITETQNGQKTISLDPDGIPEEYLPSIPLSKLVQDDKFMIILSGGKTNGN